MTGGLVSVGAAAPQLGISDSTAYRLIDAGLFPVPVYRIGARWKVPTVPLEQFLAGLREPGHYPAPPAPSPFPAGGADTPTGTDPAPVPVGVTTP